MNFNFVFNRLKNLILNPKSEWNAIELEAGTKEELIKKYAIPLMVMVAVCSIIGDSIFQSRLTFSIAAVVCKAFFVFGIAYAGMYISAIIITELASSFSSKRDLDACYRLVIYSLSAYYAASALTNLLPFLRELNILGLYSLYLFWVGAAIVLKTPDDNKVGFVVVSNLVILGVYAILTLILNAILTGIFGVGLLMK
jgi:hypothetical protein